MRALWFMLSSPLGYIMFSPAENIMIYLENVYTWVHYDLLFQIPPYDGYNGPINDSMNPFITDGSIPYSKYMYFSITLQRFISQECFVAL